MRATTIVLGLCAAVVIGNAPAIFAEEAHACVPWDGSCGYYDPDPHTGGPGWVYGNWYEPGWYYNHYWNGGRWFGHW